MAKNPFVTLGVSESVTQNELYEAYKNQRSKYLDLRFEPGEVGSDACKRLEEIEEAYRDASDKLSSNYTVSFQNNLDSAEEAIHNNDLDRAQSFLDDEQNRTARWHYLQSVVFYKKNWTNDAYKQLEFACSMDPGNTTYKEALEGMKRTMNANSTNRNRSFYGNSGEENGRTYSAPVNDQYQRRGCSACDCCSSMICADCCCECMGGDLISCC